jgi:hypothetical protein
MALQETGNYTVILSEGYEMAYNVWNCMSEKASHGIKIIF